MPSNLFAGDNLSGTSGQKQKNTEWLRLKLKWDAFLEEPPGGRVQFIRTKSYMRRIRHR